MTNGRSIVHPGSLWEDFHLPMEFAAACFRFGHSMVRDSYPTWRKNGGNNGNTGADPRLLVRNTCLGGDLVQGKVLDDDWRTRWENIIDKTPEFERVPIIASPIDSMLALYLHGLDDFQLPEDSDELALDWFDNRNLSIRTLVRGHVLELATGQELVEFVRNQLGDTHPTLPLMTSEDILSSTTYSVRDFLENDTEGTQLLHATPLWFYVLCEAVHFHRGTKIGPLGSRIVVETIHASIEAAGNGIIKNGKIIDYEFEPRIFPDASKRKQLSDIVTFVEKYWSLQ
jgi:hypothetical protein